MDGSESRIPKLIAENKDYIVLRQGCGNPCWVGYFLPLKDNIKPQSITDYLGFDLKDNLVAFINEKGNIGITNLSTGMKEEHRIKSCGSGFPGYCVDSLSIKDKILKYKWFSNT